MPTLPLPLRFDYLAAWQVVFLYAALSIPVLWLGARSMVGLDSVRKWTSIALRLDLLMFLVLLLGGARWEQTPKDLTVVVVRDVSRSTTNVTGGRDGELQGRIARYVREAAGRKPAGDRVGVVSFDRLSLVDALPDPTPPGETAACRERADGTDVAQALRLALATLPADTMRRICLFWDGNDTSGDLKTAVDAAAAQHVPIDVVPLHYHVTREVSLERLVAPGARRENEPSMVDVVIRSTNLFPVSARLCVSDNAVPLHSCELILAPGVNVQHVSVPALASGVHRFNVAVQPLAVAGSAARASIDTILENNSAEVVTLVRGRSKVLLVEPDSGRSATAPLEEALLRAGGCDVERTTAASMPQALPELLQYDAIVVVNVRRGFDGLNEAQDRALATYVKDLGGGLVVVGGPNAFGAGGWAGSQLESVLPVLCASPAGTSIPGALVLAIDRSASMGEAMPNSSRTKLQAATDAATGALDALSRQDRVGMLAFDATSTWLAPLAQNSRPDLTIAALDQVRSEGSTNIYGALTAAHAALARQSRSVTPVRHIVLLTDGRSSDGDCISAIAAMQRDGITLSTIGLGTDVDENLLSFLAWMGHGQFYRVSDAALLRQVFRREAVALGSALVQQRPIVPRVVTALGSMAEMGTLPTLHGMVTTWLKNSPGAEAVIVADDSAEPILARWRCGLGRVAAFTSGAERRWAGEWLDSQVFEKFWSNVVRGVARPLSPSGASTRVLEAAPGFAKVIVQTSAPAQVPIPNHAVVIGPNSQEPARQIRLRQTAAGTFEGEFATPERGAYLTAVPLGSEAATMMAAYVAGGSRELQDLQSNEQAVRRIAERTGGRVLTPFDPAVNLFDHNDLLRQPVSLPLTDKLIALAIFTLLLDVAVRRLAWNRQSLTHAREAVTESIRAFTHVHVGDPHFSVGALLYVHATLNERRAAAGSSTRASPGKACIIRARSAGLQEPHREELPRVAAAGSTLDALRTVHRKRGG